MDSLPMCVYVCSLRKSIGPPPRNGIDDPFRGFLDRREKIESPRGTNSEGTQFSGRKKRRMTQSDVILYDLKGIWSCNLGPVVISVSIGECCRHQWRMKFCFIPIQDWLVCSWFSRLSQSNEIRWNGETCGDSVEITKLPIKSAVAS